MTPPLPGSGGVLEERLAEMWRVDPEPAAVIRARTAALSAFAGRKVPRRRVRVPIAIAACVAVSAGTGAWAASAAAAALPGDTAYGLKRVVEQAQLTVAVSDEAEVEVLLRLADRRLDEAVRAETAGRPAAVEEALRGYGDVMEDLAPREAALPDAALRARAGQAREVHRDVLGALVDTLPPPARAAIERQLAESAGFTPEADEPGPPSWVPAPARPGRPASATPGAEGADPADRSSGAAGGRPAGTPADAGGGSVDAPPETLPDPALDRPGPVAGLPAPAQRGGAEVRPPVPPAVPAELGRESP